MRMSTELEVASWWDSLEEQARLAIGATLYGNPEEPGAVEYWLEYWDWAQRWEDLAPVGQQMRLHMYFDSEVR
jgi:hypothetical protein